MIPLLQYKMHSFNLSFSGAHYSTRYCRDGELDTAREGEIFPHCNGREGALP